MTARRSTEKWEYETAYRASHIELLFDVAFVFALAQTSAAMYADLSLTGAGRSLLLIMAFWMIWAYTTWATNLLGPDRTGTQFVLILTMLGISLMGAAVPEAFASEGPIFAAVYVIIHLGRVLYMTIALRGQQVNPRRVPMLIWFSITGTLWITGGLQEVPVRTILWATALALTIGGSRFDFWLPWRGPALLTESRLSEIHIADRYQQVIILALGEKILAAGLIFTGYAFGAEETVAFVVAFATTILLWRIYFHRAGSRMAETIAAASRKGRLALSISYAHIIMFGGIMVSSVGEKIVISHASQPADVRWVAIIAGGPALFLIGRERLHYLTAGRLARSRIVGLVVLAGLAPAMISQATAIVILMVNIVLGGIVMSNLIPRPGRRAPTPPPLK